MSDYSKSICIIGHLAPLNAVVFSGDGRFLASGGDDGYAWITDLDNGYRQRISTKQIKVTSLRWLPYTQASGIVELLTGGADGSIKLWRKAGREVDFKRAASITPISGSIEDICVCAHQGLVAIVGGDSVLVYKLNPSIPDDPAFIPRPGDLEGTIGGKIQETGLVRWVQFTNEGKELMVGVLDTRVVMKWDLVTKRRIWREKLETRIGTAAWNEETNTLLVWNLENGIDVYIVGDRPVLHGTMVLNIQRNFPIEMAFIDNDTVASGSDNGQVLIWNITQRRVSKILLHHQTKPIVVFAVGVGTRRRGDNTHIFIASGSAEPTQNGTVFIWTTDSDHILIRQPPRELVEAALRVKDRGCGLIRFARGWVVELLVHVALEVSLLIDWLLKRNGHLPLYELYERNRVLLLAVPITFVSTAIVTALVVIRLT